MDGEWDLMATSGAESVRTAFYWPQRAARHASPPDLAHLDGLVLQAARRGIARAADRDGHARLGGEPARRRDLSPARSAALRRLPARAGRPLRAAGLAVGRAPRDRRAADPRVADLERAEPHALLDAAARPGLRAQLREAAARRAPALRAADPGRARSSPGSRTSRWIALRRVYKAGGRRSFDAVALHPYTGKPRNVVRLAEYARREMRRFGDAPQADLGHRALLARGEGQDEEHDRLRDHRPRPGAAARRRAAAARPRPQAARGSSGSSGTRGSPARTRRTRSTTPACAGSATAR